MIFRATIIILLAALIITLIIAVTLSWFWGTMEFSHQFVVQADGVLYIYVPASVENTGRDIDAGGGHASCGEQQPAHGCFKGIRRKRPPAVICDAGGKGVFAHHGICFLQPVYQICASGGRKRQPHI